MTVKNPNDPASAAQLAAIDKLLVRLSDQDTLDGPSERSCAYKRLSDGLTKGQASSWIEELQKLPAPPPEGDLKLVVDHLAEQRENGKINDFGRSLLEQYEQKGYLSEKQIASIVKRVKPKENSEPQPLVPAGRYAVTIDGVLLFVRVWRGTRDPSVQQVYLLMASQEAELDGSIEYLVEGEGQRMKPRDEARAATLIAADPAAAAEEYGRRTGHCWRCAGKLEVNLSRELVMGPECMKHVYDDATRYSKMAGARRALRDRGLDPKAKHDDLAPVA
jgi:hypothetical protein